MNSIAAELAAAAAGPLLSPLFPHVWLALPSFFLGCVVVRMAEGPRQSFSPWEALSTLLNASLLGALWSSRSVMAFLLDPSKTDMSAPEFLCKLALASLIMDASFYGIHRALHRFRWLARFHARHHALHAKHTVWGGLDEDWQETLLIFVYLNAPFLLLSVTREFYLVYILAGSFQTALMHGTSNAMFPPWPFVNASFHHRHHMYENKNFGGAFVFWDALFSTTKKEQQPKQAAVAE
jgi:sterol desaturase/sphingolipid hydroxylase (fatty acid hydroxylase superfamily)